MSSPLAIAAFVLAGYAVIGNDALQTLGPFLAANCGRTPRVLQFAWLAVLLAAVLLLGWWWSEGDPAWGRLQTFTPLTDLRWIDLLPSLSVLLLTQWGAPVSTSFLVLTAVDPASLQPLLRHSLAGYGTGLAVGLLAALLPAVLSLEGVDVVETGDDYIHATATSRLFGFVDDLEVHADADGGVIEVRSVSRLGDSDLGVNARRLAALRRSLPGG